MKYKCEQMKSPADADVKVRFIGTFRASVIEQAIMMIAEVDNSHRPFINPFNGIVQFRLKSITNMMNKPDVIAAMMDNIVCLETYGKFVNSIDESGDEDDDDYRSPLNYPFGGYP